LVVPVYFALALATGSVLLCLMLAGFGRDLSVAAGVSTLMLAVGWMLKARYWVAIDGAERTYTAESATGLGALGTVRPLDPPHTQPNYVMREMGYQVARRHAGTLRRLAVLLLFVLPMLFVLVQFAPLPRTLQIAFAVLATISAVIGVLVERWLFFAEAEHVVMVYYRGGAA
jgi:DMSO reductase anchor subunit